MRHTAWLQSIHTLTQNTYDAVFWFHRFRFQGVLSHIVQRTVNRKVICYLCLSLPTCIRFIIIINHTMCSMLGCWSLNAIVFVSITSNSIYIFFCSHQVLWPPYLTNPGGSVACVGWWPYTHARGLCNWWPALFSVLVRRNCVVSLSVKLVTRCRNLHHDRLV